MEAGYYIPNRNRQAVANALLKLLTEEYIHRVKKNIHWNVKDIEFYNKQKKVCITDCNNNL